MLILLIPGIDVEPAQAWSRNGHMIIAAMTYRALPADLQKQYTELLHHHPDFEKWQRDYQSHADNMSQGEFLFMYASIWPDLIRRLGNSPYDHPTWHYTNFPVIPDDFPLEETLTPENDVLHALDVSRRVLVDSTQTLVDRAAHLSWILHVVGDVHQPLHTVALVNELFPEGDRGGNLFYIKPTEKSNGLNLHSYWDGLLGTSGKITDVRNDATLIWNSRRELLGEEPGMDLDYRSWALEGREVAIANVYLDGKLQATPEENREQASILPEAYGERAKRIAKVRALVASLRLRHMLSEG